MGTERTPETKRIWIGTSAATFSFHVPSLFMVPVSPRIPPEFGFGLTIIRNDREGWLVRLHALRLHQLVWCEMGQ